MGDAEDNFGNASELIRQGLMRAGVPRDTPQMPTGTPAAASTSATIAAPRQHDS